ncbi:MAG: nucleotide exchange factor GrpE [bacterium]|nr:nucleotide exchange factor GrpE [bacterium]
MGNNDTAPTTDEDVMPDTAQNTVQDEVPVSDTPNNAPPAPDVAANGSAQANTATSANIPQELIALRQEAEKNLQGWQRALADFQNYKRRAEREQQDAHKKAAFDTLMKFVPMFDDFERALANVPEELQGNPWLNGVSLIQNKFNKLLEELGVSVIDPVGQPFDPSQHEAVGRDESAEAESGTVTAVLQKGYSAGDRVLRPALVRVAG